MPGPAPAVPDPSLADLLRVLAPRPGITASLVPEVQLIRADHPVPRAPIVYEPSIIIVAQGRKRVFLGELCYTYDPSNYLVLSVPLPLECETEASPANPLLAVAIRVDPTALGELLLAMDDGHPVPDLMAGVHATPLTEDIACATVRLLECLQSPMDSRLLGSSIVREITYRVLCGEQGGGLRAAAARHGRFSQIARVLRRVHQEYPQELDVETLAREANMSVSNFHHNFKAVTATSPLQYLKRIRLHQARLLILQGEHNVSTAASQVGYSSLSQFSREFKRCFGTSPTHDAGAARG